MMATLFPCCLCLAVFASVSASADIEWTSDSLPDGATVKACIGETAELQWAFSLQPDDTVVKVEWFTIKDGVEQFLATSTSGHFFKSPATGLNLVFLPNAGLRVSNHTWQDFGQYRVTVHVARNGALLSSSRSAVLSPPDAPVLATERLVAKLLPHPKLDVTTGEVQLQLSCGQFANVGSRPVSIVWRTPSGKIVPSTTMSRGSFLLTLSNPVQAGTYECRLEDPSVADKCVQNLSVIKLRAHVTVHQVPARLSLLDAQVDVLQQKTEEADSGIKDWQAALASDVSDLRSEIEKQIHADISLRNDVVNLTEKLNDVMTSVTSLTSRVDDLSTENEQLKEKLKQQDNDSVYFSAYITGGDIHASADQVIRFSEVVDNTGNAYNPHTGAFTAPYDGGYMFFVSVDVSASYAWLKVMRNEQKVVEGNDDGSSRQITTGVALTLNVGDTVTVQHCCTRGYIDQGPESVFVGFRVR